MTGNDHLSDALAVVERKGLLGEIDHKDLHENTDRGTGGFGHTGRD